MLLLSIKNFETIKNNDSEHNLINENLLKVVQLRKC